MQNDIFKLTLSYLKIAALIVIMIGSHFIMAQNVNENFSNP